MGEPLSDEPRRWDELLSKARSRTPDVVARLPVEACMVFTELAAALEEERDHRDSAVEYSKHQHDELVLHRQEIDRLTDKLHEAEIEDGHKLRQVGEQWREIQELREEVQQHQVGESYQQGYDHGRLASEKQIEEERQRADQWKDSALAAERRGLCGAADVDAELPLRERLRDAIADTDLLDDYEAKQQVIDAVLPILSAEVTAKVSEAQVAVPEPLAVGEVLRVERNILGGFDHVTVSVRRRPLLTGVVDGDEVGIWPASLAEQVADRELDNEGLQRELEHAWSVAETERQDREAMTAVAKRLLGKDTVIHPDSDRVARWFSDDRLVTDADRRALDVLNHLSETREGEGDD